MQQRMSADMEATSSAEIISRRNKAVICALCRRLSLDPKKFLTESAATCDIMSLVSNIFQSSAIDASFSKNQDEVMKWATFVSKFPDERDACHSTLKGLNQDLAQKSVLLGGLKPSVADVIVFSALHSFVSHLLNEEAEIYPNIIRWADYIQHKEDFGGAFDVIVVNKLNFQHFVLCASNHDHTTVEPLIPPEGAKIGERVSFSGFEGKPEDVLNPKKKQLEKITQHLYTDDKGVATYKGVPLHDFCRALHIFHFQCKHQMSMRFRLISNMYSLISLWLNSLSRR